jgi:hypothetical protein
MWQGCKFVTEKLLWHKANRTYILMYLVYIWRPFSKLLNGFTLLKFKICEIRFVKNNKYSQTSVSPIDVIIWIKDPEVKVRVKVTLRLAVYCQSFHLGYKPLEDHDQIIFNWTLAVIVLMWYPLWREDGFVSYEYASLFVKCTYRTYRMLLKILPCALHTCPLSVQALQLRSCAAAVIGDLLLREKRTN